MGKSAQEIALRAEGEPGGIAQPPGGELHQDATGFLGKAFSHVQHLLKGERRRWALLLAAAFGAMLTIGHVIGGVSGLMDGYERLAKTWFGSEGGEAYLANSDMHVGKHAHALANELRAEFLRARDKLEQTNAVDFSRAEEALASLRRVDDRSGHLWYFQGEIKRLKNTELFTSKSCMKALPLGRTTPTDAYRNDFYRYLELVNALPARIFDTEVGSEVCYEKSNGYCIQRIAWIHHLLANDYYQEAAASSAAAERVQKLKRATTHAREAHRYHDPEGVEGFAQCTATIALEQDIDEQLRAVEKKP